MQSPPIGTMDALFLDVEKPATLSIIASLTILDPATASDGLVRHRDILGYLNGRLHLAPQWRQKLIFNPFQLEEPRLVDDPDFDLEFHVRHIALPNPHDERQLKILAARLFSRPMDINRPLWELYVIEGLGNCASFPKDSFALFLKMHHTVFDGAAALNAMAAMFQRTPDEIISPPDKSWTPAPAPGMIDWLTGSTTHYFKRLTETMTALPGMTKSAWTEAQSMIEKARNEAEKEVVPVTRLQATVTSHRMFDWLAIPIDRFEATRRALGKPKMNDFVMAIIGGGLRRYLDAHGELPTETLVSLCPVNIRPKNEAEMAGNQVAFMRLPFGTATADPMERIKLIADVSIEKKKHVTKTGGTLAMDVLGLMPYVTRSFVIKNLMKLMSTGRMKPMVNAVVTNVPQPAGEFYFAGARLVSRVGLAPLTDQVGLTNVVSSTSFEVTFSATSCRQIMPDISNYMACVMESFEEYEAIANVQGNSVVPKPKRRTAANQPA